MKYSFISIIITLTILTSCQSISFFYRNKIDIEDKQLDYKILSIDSLNLEFVYFITLLYKNNNDTIELISQKKECPNIYNQIKVNEKYKLSLYRVGQFPIKVLADGDTAYRRVAYCNYDHNKPRFVNHLYSTSNLCGLNYLNDSTKIKHK